MSDKYRFEEIKMQIKELLEEAFELVPEHAKSRSESYWYSQIAVALDDDHGYLGGSMCSMQDTLEEFDDYEEEDVYIVNDTLPNEGPINDDDWDIEAGRPANMRDEDWD